MEELYNECMEYLSKAYENSLAYNDITAYDIVFEDTNSLNNKIQANNKAISNVSNNIANAFNKVLEFIRNVLLTIGNFFKTVFHVNKEKELQNMIKNNPETVKTIKIPVDKKNLDELDTAYNDASVKAINTLSWMYDNPDKLDTMTNKCMDDLNRVIELTKKLQTNAGSHILKSTAKGIITSLDAASTLQVAANRRKNAKAAYLNLITNEKKIKQLQDKYGKITTDKYIKTLKSYTHPLSLSSLYAKATHAYASTQVDAYEQIITNFTNVLNNDVPVTKKIKSIASNKHLYGLLGNLTPTSNLYRTDGTK